MPRVLPLVLLAALALPAAASAATPATPQTPTLKLKFQRLVRPGLALTGQAFRVSGVVRPFVAGQHVVVRVKRGFRKIRVKTVLIRGAGGGQYGHFILRVISGKPGRITVRASHSATPEFGTVVAKPIHLRVRTASVSFGARGPVVSLLQRRLAALGYAVPGSGVYDAGTGRAVLAYRKVNGLARVTSAGSDVLHRVLAGKGAFRARFPSHGRHVEADLGRQVLAELDGGKVHRVYIMSSGKPSTPTVLGTFRVYSKTPGTNAKGMFDSNYFHGGYAIHGYPDVPIYAASHGCLRVPNPDAPTIFGWVRFGTIVDVYP